MKFPSQSNETDSTERMHTALKEAARYEPETSVPGDLVRVALARHDRSGRRCDERRPVPMFVAGACGLALLVSGAVWLRLPHRLVAARHRPGPVTAFQTGQKAALPDQFTLPRIDIAPTLLPPINPTRWLTAAERSRIRHRIDHNSRRRRQHFSEPQSRLTRAYAICATGVWTTETVHREVVLQTLTPVWVAHADPETQTIALTPALFQLSLQSDNDADSTTPTVGAALIPVRFEQENHQP